MHHSGLAVQQYVDPIITAIPKSTDCPMGAAPAAEHGQLPYPKTQGLLHEQGLHVSIRIVD